MRAALPLPLRESGAERVHICAGSHKANINLPAHMRDLSKFVHPTIKPIPAKAGDCIIFTSVPARL